MRKKFERWAKIQEILDNVKVEAETICNPSEDLDKVKKAILNVLEGEISIKESSNQRFILSVKGRGEKALLKIFNGFRNRAVLASVRKHLKEHSSRNEVIFMLNKQAAYLGTMAIYEEGESALGGIKVVIKAPEIKKLIDWLTRF